MPFAEAIQPPGLPTPLSFSKFSRYFKAQIKCCLFQEAFLKTSYGPNTGFIYCQYLKCLS